MRLAVLALALVLLAGCVPPAPEIIYVYMPADEPAVEEPAPEPEEPAWQPEPWHLYVLDSRDAILVDEEARPQIVYETRLRCWLLQCEVQGMEHPDDPWRVVGGGML